MSNIVLTEYQIKGYVKRTDGRYYPAIPDQAYRDRQRIPKPSGTVEGDRKRRSIMKTEVRVNGATSSVTRGDIAAGEVFSSSIKGKRGKKRYASIGKNGRYFSVDIDSGALSSRESGKGKVFRLGTFTYDISLAPKGGKTTTRGSVKTSEVFRVRTANGKWGDELYAHVGEFNQGGMLSIHLNGKRNHAVSHRGSSAVQIVGSFTINAEVLA